MLSYAAKANGCQRKIHKNIIPQWSGIQNIILYLSINSNTNLKLTITKLHFTTAQMYFKPSCRQTKSSAVSCSSIHYHSSYLHSAFTVPGRHHTCSAYTQAVALNKGTQQSCCFPEPSDYCTCANYPP